MGFGRGGKVDMICSKVYFWTLLVGSLRSGARTQLGFSSDGEEVIGFSPPCAGQAEERARFREWCEKAEMVSAMSREERKGSRPFPGQSYSDTLPQSRLRPTQKTLPLKLQPTDWDALPGFGRH